jgi:Putative metal-binding motif/Right handed beta helix region
VSDAPYDVYVAMGGNDTNDCRTAELACQTVTEAVRKSVAGGTIIIGAGTFPEPHFVLIEMPLTIQGAGQTSTFLSSSSDGVIAVRGRDGQVTINNLTALGNTTAESAPVIGVDRGGTLTLERVSVTDNLGTGLGVFNSTATVANGTFLRNSIGIYNARGALQVRDTSIRNSSEKGIFNSGVAALERVSLDENTISNPSAPGAAIDNSKLSAEDSGILSINQSTLTDNPGFGVLNNGGRVSILATTFTRNGQGVLNSGGFVRILNSVIQDSIGAGLGVRTVAAEVPAVMEITQTAILRNATGIYSEAATIRAENVTLSGNSSAALVVSSSELPRVMNSNITLEYTTIAFNPGAGINVVSDGHITMRDSIVVENAPGRNCSDLSRFDFADLNFACDETLTATGVGIDRVLSPEAGTFVHALLVGSLAIDTATGACPAQDQRGYGRPYDGNGDLDAVCDVGAYEFGSSMAIVAVTPSVIEIIPSETPTAAITPTPGVSMLVLVQNANCRHGPGSVYPVLTSFLQGQSLQVDGRSAAAPLWWQVALPNSTQHCWVSNAAGTPDGDPNGLPVIPAPPTPMPTIAPESGGGAKDNDGDGFKSDVDCDDKNAKIHPGAAETAKDGVDSNCDGKDDS